MKLQLRSLRAINCGPLRDVCIHFNIEGDAPVTVLGGANGSGKTTALELIVALCEILDPATQERPLPGIFTRTEYAQVDWLVDGESFSVFYGARPSVALLPDSYFGRINSKLPYHDIEQGAVYWQMLRVRMQVQQQAILTFAGDSQLLDERGEESPELPSILYFPHNRSFLPVKGEQIQREETKYHWVYGYDAIRDYAGSLDSFLVWLDYAEPEVFSRVIEFLNALDLDGKTFSVRRKELKVIVTTRDGHTHYLEDLSSGEQNILIMLLELRRRLLPYSIVLIDEVENSLHPAFQYRLAEGLRRLQEMIPFQLIVTTHAPAFVEIFGAQNTRILTEF